MKSRRELSSEISHFQGGAAAEPRFFLIAGLDLSASIPLQFSFRHLIPLLALGPEVSRYLSMQLLLKSKHVKNFRPLGLGAD